MDALSKQLETLKTIVPEEKETDELSASAAGCGGFVQRGIAAAESQRRGSQGQRLF